MCRYPVFHPDPLTLGGGNFKFRGSGAPLHLNTTLLSAEFWGGNLKFLGGKISPPKPSG